MRPPRTWWPTSRRASSVPTEPRDRALRRAGPGTRPTLPKGPRRIRLLAPLPGLSPAARGRLRPRAPRTRRLRPRGAPAGWILDLCLPYNVGAPRTVLRTLSRGLPSTPEGPCGTSVERRWNHGGRSGEPRPIHGGASRAQSAPPCEPRVEKLTLLHSQDRSEPALPHRAGQGWTSSPPSTVRPHSRPNAPHPTLHSNPLSNHDLRSPADSCPPSEAALIKKMNFLLGGFPLPESLPELKHARP